MKHLLHLMLLCALATTPLAHAADDAPARYAAHWDITLPAGASVVRLQVPAAAMAQLQTRDWRDLRVFNAAGTAVPMAVQQRPPETVQAEPQPVILPALPIMGPADAANDVALRIEERAGQAVVRVETGPGRTRSTAEVQIGVLVDLGQGTTALDAVALDANWPAARPFTFRLDAGNDLQLWSHVGDLTVFRDAAGVIIADAHLPLQGKPLQARFLRISWDVAGTGESTWVRSVRLLPQAASTPSERVAVALNLPEALEHDAHVLEWQFPFATPLAALDLRAREGNMLVPLRVLARQNDEAPWTPLASQSIFTLTQDGQSRHNDPMVLKRGAWPQWRLEADPAGPGFARWPQMTALFDPVQVVFVATGEGPYTLAAGRADAPRRQLALDDLLAGVRDPGVELRWTELPLAQLAVPEQATTATLVAVRQRRGLQWLLWAVLVAGVLLLGAMAWLLMRQAPAPGTTP